MRASLTRSSSSVSFVFGELMTDADSNLWSDSEDELRFAIIEASRTRDSSKLPRLLTLLHTDTYSNRRHITRALGSIGGDEAQRALLELLEQEEGLILGDIAKSLGQLKVIAALSSLQTMQDHQSDWVRQSARWACQEMQKTTEPNAAPNGGPATQLGIRESRRGRHR